VEELQRRTAPTSSLPEVRLANVASRFAHARPTSASSGWTSPPSSSTSLSQVSLPAFCDCQF